MPTPYATASRPTNIGRRASFGYASPSGGALMAVRVIGIVVGMLLAASPARAQNLILQPALLAPAAVKPQAVAAKKPAAKRPAAAAATPNAGPEHTGSVER